MDDLSNDVDDTEIDTAPAPDATPNIDGAAPARSDDDNDQQAERARVAEIIATIKSDAKFFENDFKQMRDDMFAAFHGRNRGWSDNNYKANITGRHVKQKTASLYAKNPKATAKRKPRLDFAVWDEDPQSLMLAFQTLQTGIMAAQAHAAEAEAAATPDPLAQGAPIEAPGAAAAQSAHNMIGHNGGPPLEMPPGFDQAKAIVEDFQQGMERRKKIDKLGKTLEILFANSMREQKPVDFKTGMKQLVRRTCTTSVGYIELGFQRDKGPRPGLTEQLADSQQRLEHLRVLLEDLKDEEYTETSAEMFELESSIAALQSEPEIVIREGLIFDFPRSTKVIPDQLTKTLVGFIGARHITIEYDFTHAEVRELFNVDLKKWAGYSSDGKADVAAEAANTVRDDSEDEDDKRAQPTDAKKKKLVKVWKFYEKASGLVHYVADGHDLFLRPPAPPDVFVEDFWPVYAITFNEVESEDRLFPPSDVKLLEDMQSEHNRSRQGKREHRDAKRPRWVAAKGALENDDVKILKDLKPFEVALLNIDPQTEIGKMLQAVPVPGVDPNLYDTNEVNADMQLVVGAQQAQLGGVSKSSATESAIAESSASTADGSSVDDLDAFLTVITRAASQILLREMSAEQVLKIVGPGAVWPELTDTEIAEEVYLDIEAGSTGKPNQAVEMNNWKMMLPFLIQMEGIRPEWLARETLRRLDDRMDLTDALSAGIPSMIARNSQRQPAPADPGNAPDQQGGKGQNNASKPSAEKSAGSGPAFGSNQV